MARIVKRAKTSDAGDSLLIEIENISSREEEAATIRDALRVLRDQRLIPDNEFPGTLMAIAIEVFVGALKASGLSSRDAARTALRFHERVIMLAAAYGTLTKESVEKGLVSMVAAGESPLEQMVINLRIVHRMNAREIADQLMTPGRMHLVTSRVQQRHPENRALVRAVERILKKHRALLETYALDPYHE